MFGTSFEKYLYCCDLHNRTNAWQNQMDLWAKSGPSPSCLHRGHLPWATHWVEQWWICVDCVTPRLIWVIHDLTFIPFCWYSQTHECIGSREFVFLGVLSTGIITNCDAVYKHRIKDVKELCFIQSMTSKYIWAATWDFQQCGMCDQ